MDEGELVSCSWDAFVFCLDSYDPFKFDTHVPYFFSRYTDYWLIMYFAKTQEHIMIPLEDLEDAMKTVESPENIAFGKLLRLYRYRETLEDEVKVVWDDALLSLSHSDSCKQSYKSPDTDLPQRVYYTLKNSFKGIIRQILEE